MAPELSARHQKMLGAIARADAKVQTARARFATATAAHDRAIYAALIDGVPTEAVREATGMTIAGLRRIRLHVAQEIQREEARKGSQP